MNKKFSELDEATGEHLDSILQGQVNRSFEAVVETDKWLTQHNFLINAGGAAVTLGYLSSDAVDHFTSLAVYPLMAFLVGIIAGAIQNRYLLKMHSELYEDALYRRGGFVSDSLTVEQAATINAPTSTTKYIKSLGGWLAQFSFVFGCGLGIVGLICS